MENNTNYTKLTEKVAKLQATVDSIKEDVNKISTDVSELNHILLPLGKSISALEIITKNNTDRITKLETSLSKVVWAIVSAFLTALAGLVISTGGIKK